MRVICKESFESKNGSLRFHERESYYAEGTIVYAPNGEVHLDKETFDRHFYKPE